MDYNIFNVILTFIDINKILIFGIDIYTMRKSI